jgi:hypothetical protein
MFLERSVKMGILTNKDNEPNAGKELENMLDMFNIDLGDIEEDIDKDEERLSEKRKAKKDKEKLEF